MNPYLKAIVSLTGVAWTALVAAYPQLPPWSAAAAAALSSALVFIVPNLAKPATVPVTVKPPSATGTVPPATTTGPMA